MCALAEQTSLIQAQKGHAAIRLGECEAKEILCSPRKIGTRLKLEHRLAAERWKHSCELMVDAQRKAFAMAQPSRSQAKQNRAEWLYWTLNAHAVIAQRDALMRSAMQYLMAALSHDTAAEEAAGLLRSAWTVQSSAAQIVRAAMMDADPAPNSSASVPFGLIVRLRHSLRRIERSILFTNSIGDLLQLKAGDADIHHNAVFARAQSRAESLGRALFAEQADTARAKAQSAQQRIDLVSLLVMLDMRELRGKRPVHMLGVQHIRRPETLVARLDGLEHGVQTYEPQKESDKLVADYQLALLATEVADSIVAQTWANAHAQACAVAQWAHRRMVSAHSDAVKHAPGYHEDHAGYADPRPRQNSSSQRRRSI